MLADLCRHCVHYEQGGCRRYDNMAAVRVQHLYCKNTWFIARPERQICSYNFVGTTVEVGTTLVEKGAFQQP